MRNGQGFAAIDRPAAEHQAAHEDRKQQVTGDAAQNRNEDQHYVQDNRDNDDQDPGTHGRYEQTPAFAQPCDAPADIDGTRVNGWRGRERPGRGGGKEKPLPTPRLVCSPPSGPSEPPPSGRGAFRGGVPGGRAPQGGFV